MAKTLSIVFGIVFVLVGILGYMNTGIVGMNGVFQTDGLHNLVHLLFGLILLVVAFMAPAKSALWLKILGIVYLVLAILGFLTIAHGGMLLGLVQMNMADHWLHLVLGVVLVLAGMSKKGGASGGMSTASNPM